MSNQIDSVNAVEHNRGLRENVELEWFKATCPDEIKKAAAHLLTGDPTATDVHITHSEQQFLINYLFRLYLADCEKITKCLDQLAEADRKQLAGQIEGSPNAKFNLGNKSTMEQLLTRFPAVKSALKTIFLDVYQKRFKVDDVPADFEVPAPDAVIEQIDICRTGGDPRSFTQLRTLIAKIEEADRKYKTAKIPSLVEFVKIKDILTRLETADFDLRQAQETFEEARRDYEKIEQALAAAKVEVTNREGGFSNSQQHYDHLKGQKSTTELELATAKDDADEARYKIKTAEDKVRDIEINKLPKLNQELQTAKADLIKAKRKAKAVEDKVHDIETNKLPQLSQELQTAKTDLDEARRKLKVAENKARNIETNKLSQLNQELQVAKTDLNEARRRLGVAESEACNIETKLPQLSQELQTAKINLVTAKAGKQNVLREFAVLDRGALRHELSQFNDEIAKKKKSVEKCIKTPVSGSTMVYLCMRKEHELLGKTGKNLDNAVAESFSHFSVGITSVDFDGLPDAKSQSLFEKGKHAVQGEITAVLESTRDSIRFIFNWPIFAGLSLKASEEEIEHRIKDVPMEDIVGLIAFLRHKVAERDKGKLSGVPAQELTPLERFVVKLEKIAAEKMAKKIVEESKDKKEEEIRDIVNITRTLFEKNLQSSEHDPHGVQHKWQHMKKHEEEHHGDGKKIVRAGTLIAIWELCEIVLEFLFKIKRKGGAKNAAKKEAPATENPSSKAH